MTFAPGSRIGSYEVVAPLGAGGMGEVFRARDRLLHREVALKVLPAALAADRDRLARLRREAQVLASLNHPSIAAIYGLVETDGPDAEHGTLALALELVEGQDLTQRLADGPIAVDEAIAIARQIAEGLEAAHEKGVVHRDLKPGNVKVTAEGVVKLLDFGLAKAWDGDGPPDTLMTHSPTLSRNMTEAGVILGTAAYMSPEQARGKPVDKRSDIWSFGVVLYEMLTGARVFSGETVSDVLAAVLRQDVDLSALPADTPTRVRQLVARCLERDPRKRLRDIGEARLALGEPLVEPASGAVMAVAARRPPGSGADSIPPARAPVAGAPGRLTRATAALALLAAAATAVAVWAVARLEAPPRPGLTRTSIVLPPGQVLAGIAGPAISKDGRLVAYSARDATGIARLYLRALDRFEPVVVPESEGAQIPFFSHDGSRVGFFARRKLFTASVAGGPPSPVADASAQPQGGTWLEDDTIVYSPALSAGLMRVPAAGGRPEPITTLDGTGGYAHSKPSGLPGGRAVLFTSWGGAGSKARGPWIVSLGDGKLQSVLSGRYWTSRYSVSGHLLISSSRGIRATAFDPERPGTPGPEAFVVDEVYGTMAWAESWFAVSDTGTLIYVPGDFLLGTLTWVDREGGTATAFDKPVSLSDPALSPDGERITFQDRDDVLWTMDLRRGTRTQLTTDEEAVSAYPVWSADGSRVIFASNRGGDWEIYSVAASGGPAAKLLARPGNQFPVSLAPDGTLLFNERALGRHGSDLLTVSPGGEVTPFVDAQPASKAGGQFSPDGRVIAYVSDENGRDEVYVKPFGAAGGLAVPVSTEGGVAPRWSPDGTEVFYRRGDTFFSASVGRSGDALRVGDSRTMFEVRAAPGRSTFQPGYSVAPDGKRFLCHVLDPTAIPTRIHVVTSWFDELRAKVPPAVARGSR